MTAIYTRGGVAIDQALLDAAGNAQASRTGRRYRHQSMAGAATFWREQGYTFDLMQTWGPVCGYVLSVGQQSVEIPEADAARYSDPFGKGLGVLLGRVLYELTGSAELQCFADA